MPERGTTTNSPHLDDEPKHESEGPARSTAAPSAPSHENASEPGQPPEDEGGVAADVFVAEEEDHD